jgi:hypothetical protein
LLRQSLETIESADVTMKGTAGEANAGKWRVLTGHLVVTGCAGLIGSHVTDELPADGRRMVGLDSFEELASEDVRQDPAGVVREWLASRPQTLERPWRPNPGRWSELTSYAPRLFVLPDSRNVIL